MSISLLVQQLRATQEERPIVLRFIDMVAVEDDRLIKATYLICEESAWSAVHTCWVDVAVLGLLFLVR